MKMILSNNSRKWLDCHYIERKIRKSVFSHAVKLKKPLRLFKLLQFITEIHAKRRQINEKNYS